MGRWCCWRRDTRGKRGYDGKGVAGMTEWVRCGSDGVRGRGGDRVGAEVGWGDGAVRVEIPAASAGMTGKGRR